MRGPLLDDARLSRRVGARFVSLVVPVTLTMAAVVWSVTCLSPIYVNGQAPAMAVVDERDANSVGEKVVYSLASALIVVGCVVVVTFAMVALYHFHLEVVLYAWLAFSAVSIFFLQLWIWLDLFCTYFQIPYNAISMGVFIWNVGVVGVVSTFYYAHPTVTQVYMIVASISVAWSLTALPEWTTWALLFTFATYDIVAVLSRQGPLHLLIRVAQERQEPIPGFVYDSAGGVAPLVRPATQAPPPPVPAGSAQSPDTTLATTVRHAAPFKLGLGDFIFYSLLVGRASLSGFVPWSFCMISVLTGMVGTLLSLLLFRDTLHALPALPCSIFLSIAVFVGCKLVLGPLGIFASHTLLVL